MRTGVTEGVIQLLRNRILLGQYVGRLPAERVLCEQLEASRWCIRIALERLSAEGLLMPVAGKRWQVLTPSTEGNFELTTNCFSALGHDGFLTRVRELLDHRSQHFVAAVDVMVTDEIAPSAEARSALSALGIGTSRHDADKVLADEDQAMTQLISSDASLVQQLAAHQVRRAMAKLRSLLKLDFYLRHLEARFNPLYEAVTQKDRDHAVLFAREVAQGRDRLYLKLAEEAVAPAEPKLARYIFGEN